MKTPKKREITNAPKKTTQFKFIYPTHLLKQV